MSPSTRQQPPSSLERTLQQGLESMGCPLAAEVRQQLLAYVVLLEKWNRTYNLTAVRDPAEMITKHILDSLAVLPHIKGPRVLDVGTGAGLPGIPLALARPEWGFVLLDSNAKKTRFVTQACAELGLKNVEVVTTRVDKYHPEGKFDTLISRAFSAIADMLASTRHLCGQGGRFLAMKGVYPEEELKAIPAGYQVSAVQPLTIPGLGAARHVAIIIPSAN